MICWLVLFQEALRAHRENASRQVNSRLRKIIDSKQWLDLELRVLRSHSVSRSILVASEQPTTEIIFW